MGKLFNLKEWLTIPETARHLSIAFGEEVSEADVLRLGLDGQLQLSVNFVNHAKARCGRITTPDKARTVAFPADVSAAVKAKAPGEYTGGYVQMVLGPSLSTGEVIDLEDDIVTLDGVYDLPMIGGERLDIEHKYQMLTDGPAVTLSNIDGAFVEGTDSTICQLQESYDDNEFMAGSRAQLARLNERIAEGGIDSDRAKSLLEKHAEERKVFLEKQRSDAPKNRYHPAGGLPRDVALVVRTGALRAFERDLATGQASTDDGVIRSKERTTFLNTIGGLLALMLELGPTGKTRSGYACGCLTSWRTRSSTLSQRLRTVPPEGNGACTCASCLRSSPSCNIGRSSATAPRCGCWTRGTAGPARSLPARNPRLTLAVRFPNGPSDAWLPPQGAPVRRRPRGIKPRLNRRAEPAPYAPSDAPAARAARA